MKRSLVKYKWKAEETAVSELGIFPFNDMYTVSEQRITANKTQLKTPFFKIKFNLCSIMLKVIEVVLYFADRLAVIP